MITQYIKDKKNLTSQFLTNQKQILKNLFNKDHLMWSDDAIDRLIDFTKEGKMLRGTLVFLGYEIATGNPSSSLVPLAGAMELLQTSLLIHDDIMDQDELRRGNKSMYMQYKEKIEEQIQNPKRSGESLAICLGNIGYFLSFQYLSKMSIADDARVTCQTILSEEMIRVNCSQMQDVVNGDAKDKKASEDDILNIYRHKTGRYTCGLPLVLGATIGNAKSETIDALWKFGETLGILFQIVDDKLNLYGNPDVTGKPVGSDIREGKQTLMMYELFDLADTKTKKEIEKFRKKKALSEEDIVFVRTAMTKYGVDANMQSKIEQYTMATQYALQHIQMAKPQRDLLTEFVEFVTNRVY